MKGLAQGILKSIRVDISIDEEESLSSAINEDYEEKHIMKTERIAITRCRRELNSIFRKLEKNKLEKLIVTKNNIEYVVILSSDIYRQLAHT